MWGLSLRAAAWVCSPQLEGGRGARLSERGENLDDVILFWRGIILLFARQMGPTPQVSESRRCLEAGLELGCLSAHWSLRAHVFRRRAQAAGLSALGAPALTCVLCWQHQEMLRTGLCVISLFLLGSCRAPCFASSHSLGFRPRRPLISVPGAKGH